LRTQAIFERLLNEMQQAERAGVTDRSPKGRDVVDDGLIHDSRAWQGTLSSLYRAFNIRARV
jgi:hypothetical protein